MGSNQITIDSHALIWYVDKLLNSKLSDRALNAIVQAETNGVIYIPMIVLLETLRLIEKGKSSLIFDEILSRINESENYKIVSFDMDLLKAVIPIKGLELHDRLIVATAIITNTDLVSVDSIIRTNNAGVNVIW